MYRITNNGKGPRGVHSTAGVLVWIAPGASKVVDAANIATERRVPTLTIEPVGDVEAPPASLKAKLEKKLPDLGDMKREELEAQAEKEGVDLDAIKGTGKGGNVLVGDIKKAIETKRAGK